MFNFIRGMFDKSATTSDMTWNVPVFNYEYEGRGVDFPYLSQSELQMLQRIVADAVFEEEQHWKIAKYEAQLYPVGDEERNYWFKYARKHQSKLKKLSALQYRLKHKIVAEG